MPLCNFSEKRAPVSVTRWLYVAARYSRKGALRRKKEREREKRRTGTLYLIPQRGNAATVRQSDLRIAKSTAESTVANALRNDAPYQERGSRAINVMQGSSSDAMRCDAMRWSPRLPPEALARIPVARCGHGEFLLSFADGVVEERKEDALEERRVVPLDESREKFASRSNEAGVDAVICTLGSIYRISVIKNLRFERKRGKADQPRFEGC